MVASQNGSCLSSYIKIYYYHYNSNFIIIVYYSSRGVIFFRPVENIRGFSRETVIEVTTNIESQERRRLLNEELGCAEHPRAYKENGWRPPILLLDPQ